MGMSITVQRKFTSYGKLSDQSIDELEIGASQRTGEEQSQRRPS